MLRTKYFFKITLSILFIFTFILVKTYGQQPKKIRTIIVDAGHGGTNTGATGLNSKIQEKEYTLKIATAFEK